MGEIAEMMIDGTLCQMCGGFISEGEGYPRYCSDECRKEHGIESKTLPKFDPFPKKKKKGKKKKGEKLGVLIFVRGGNVQEVYTNMNIDFDIHVLDMDNNAHGSEVNDIHTIINGKFVKSIENQIKQLKEDN